jgi:hypothetical protein
MRQAKSPVRFRPGFVQLFQIALSRTNRVTTQSKFFARSRLRVGAPAAMIENELSQSQHALEDAIARVSGETECPRQLSSADRSAEADFAGTVERLRAGIDTAAAIDDRFVAAFALAGTAQQCVVQARQYFEAGATELALGFVDPHPEQAMRSLGETLRQTAPLGEAR